MVVSVEKVVFRGFRIDSSPAGTRTVKRATVDFDVRRGRKVVRETASVEVSREWGSRARKVSVRQIGNDRWSKVVADAVAGVL